MSGRNQRFRRLIVESLESRELLSASSTFDPSPEALELLERINRMRIDPQGELSRIFSDLGNGIANDSRITDYFKNRSYAYPRLNALINEFSTLNPSAPLAWNGILASVADEHTSLMINRKVQDHTVTGELPLEQRLIDSGFYDPTSGKKLDFAENITAFGLNIPKDGSVSVASYLHEFLVIDFGNSSHIHRNNVMDPNFTMVGIGLQEVPPGTTGFGPWVVTVDFASFSNGEQLPGGGYLLGVAYDDVNENHMYEAGEGLGGMQIVVRSGDVIVAEFDTSSAGAYQEYLENGTYTVTISGSAFSEPITQTVVIDGQNVKVDFRPQDAAAAKPVVDLNGPGEGVNFNINFPETNKPSLIVSRDLSVTSAGLISYAVVQLQNRLDGDYEMLLVDLGGTSLASRYDSATGTLTLSGTATAADYAKVLQTLKYRNNLERPHLDARTVSVTVSNGFRESEASISTVKMDAVFLPEMTINDVKVIEGDEGVTDLVFVIELSETPRELLVVNYEIVAETAVAGVDFTPTAGRIVFDSWEQTTATITVSINTNYDPGEDRTVLLNILSATNVNLSRDQITGTILEDDNVTHLGRMPSWNESDLEFVDGRRRLYSFEAMYDGRVTWDTVLDSLPEGVRMVVYESSHSTIPIAYSTMSGGKQHLEFDVTEGIIYVVKIEGREEIDPELLPGIVSTRMAQTVRLIDDGYEILGNPNQQTGFVVDFSGGELLVGYDGIMSRVDSSLNRMIRFSGLGVDDIITIIGGGSKSNPVAVKPADEFIVINDVTVNIGGLKKINFAGTDDYDSVQLIADGDNCQFTFEDGNTTLVTATRVYRTFAVEEVNVIASGTGGVAWYYDLPSNDTFTLRSNLVIFEGGGYRIEARNFQKANVFSVSGGNDAAKIYGENDSRITFAGGIVDRNDAATSYRVWNTKTITAINADETNNSVTFLNITPGDEYYVTIGCISAVNAQRTVSCQAIGFRNAAITSLAGGTSSITVSLGTGTRIEMQDDRPFLTDGTIKILMPKNSSYAFHQFQQVVNLESQPFSPLVANAADSVHSQPAAAQFDDLTEDGLPEADAFAAAIAPLAGGNISELLLQSLAWEQWRKDHSRAGDEVDPETDLARLFAERIALLQLR